jgi:hypothetical protein
MKKSTLLEFLSLANRNAKIGGMFLGLIGCLMLSPFVLFARSDVQFMLEGERVNARVVALPTFVRTKFSSYYSYPIEFQDANKAHYSGAAIIRDASLGTGDIIPMRYLRSNPARSRSEYGLQRSWPARVFALIAVFVLFASVWNGMQGVRDILRQLREKPIEAPAAQDRSFVENS